MDKTERVFARNKETGHIEECWCLDPEDKHSADPVIHVLTNYGSGITSVSRAAYEYLSKEDCDILADLYWRDGYNDYLRYLPKTWPQHCEVCGARAVKGDTDLEELPSGKWSLKAIHWWCKEHIKPGLVYRKDGRVQTLDEHRKEQAQEAPETDQDWLIETDRD